MSDAVLISIITGGFGVIVAILGIFAKANKRDHAENSSKLDYIGDLLREHFRNHP